jgi:predicted O-linked N-acetylglucosamine transferase (SPINDLY family)
MNPATARNLRQAAAALGVGSKRLVFASHVARTDEYLARLSLADLFLDTLPYNAHTTAGDALLAGVPVLTCRGGAFAGRVGASLLRALGLEATVSGDLEEYERRALQLATSPAVLRSLCERLAAARAGSPLFDSAAYASHLERLYLELVNCNG